jgi:O-antigen ligase
MMETNVNDAGARLPGPRRPPNPRHRLIALLVTLYVASLPLEGVIPYVAPGVTVQRVLGMVLAAVYLAVFGRSVRRKSIAGAGWAWFAWVAVSIYWSSDPEFTFRRVLLLGMNLGIVLILADYVGRFPWVVRKLLWAYTAGALIDALLAFARFTTEGGFFVSGSRATASEVQQSGALSQSLLPAAFHLSRIAIFESALLWKVMAPMGLVLVTAGLLVSKTRSAWIGLVVGLVAWGAAELKPARLVRITALVIGTAWLLLMVVPESREVIQDRADAIQKTRASGRLDLFWVGVGLYLERPFLGHGYDNFAEVNSWNRASGGAFADRVQLDQRANGPHNIYMGLLVDTGPIGLVLFLWWMVSIFRRPAPLQLRGDVVAARVMLLALLVQAAGLDVLNTKVFWLFVALAEGLANVRPLQQVRYTA